MVFVDPALADGLCFAQGKVAELRTSLNHKTAEHPMLLQGISLGGSSDRTVLVSGHDSVPAAAMARLYRLLPT